MAHERRRQYTLFEWIIKNNLDPEHKLMKLAKCIEWNQVTDSLSKYYSHRGRKAKRIRMMVGLHLLKHMNNLSDKQVVEGLRENVYWMVFCGVPTEEIATRLPLHWLSPSTMTKFRKRIGAEGMQEIEKIIQNQLVTRRKTRPRLK